MTKAPPGTSLATWFPGLDKTYAALLDTARTSGAPPMAGLGPGTIRQRVRAGNPLCAPGPQMRKVADVQLSPWLSARRYVPLILRTDRILVWFHGGGWISGDIGYSEQFCRSLADGAGCEVLSVDYRLAPEHPFPAAVEDALAAVRWAASAGREVVVGGDSAGGNLAAVAAQELAAVASQELAAGAAQKVTGGSGSLPGVRPVGQLLVYPVLDTDRGRPSYLAYDGLVLGVAEMGWFFSQYLPSEQDRTNPRAAPLRASELGGLPPVVIAVAGHDPLRDEGVAYAERLRTAGVPVTLLEFPSLPHGFLRFTGPVPAAADAAGQIVAATAALTHDATPHPENHPHSRRHSHPRRHSRSGRHPHPWPHPGQLAQARKQRFSPTERTEVTRCAQLCWSGLASR
jgi:acetyl esterase